jgi:hypothetical protein
LINIDLICRKWERKIVLKPDRGPFIPAQFIPAQFNPAQVHSGTCSIRRRFIPAHVHFGTIVHSGALVQTGAIINIFTDELIN